MQQASKLIKQKQNNDRYKNGLTIARILLMFYNKKKKKHSKNLIVHDDKKL